MAGKSDRVVITTARFSRSLDAGQRERRYLLTMAVRVLCLIAAVPDTGLLRWVFVAGAALLPVFGVILANLIDKREPVAAETSASALPALPGPGTISGEVSEE